ncbi:class I SAM-dependent methyltransferase [Rhodovarius lipocyclicus]|uniref:class I SAM-dependent methyltransferase n=1 Tax=Rhodovarius lipocyclicus TaxID=268410 RepID=UPI0013582B11|nr:class I SAM-dependent methyltransferase [Rhodovarius lipocyclicus]
MTAWSQGYVADSPYTFSYQSGLVPTQLNMVCALMGVAWQVRPDLVVADIGCGRGYTVNTLAAANPGWTVLGLDYNPAHIAEAASLAERARIENAVFVEADLASMTDAEIDRLPPLDVATLHGVWTWVGDPVREGIIRLLARRLKPGGLVYVGYNALPGFGPNAALQRLFRHASAVQPSGSVRARTEGATEIVRQLLETKPAHLPLTPLLQAMVDKDDRLNPAYLVHELMTEHWRPVFFEDLAQAMGQAKLQYVGSVTLHENIPDTLFSPEQRALYEATPPGPMRELVKDICIQRPFRRDVFARGLVRTDPDQAVDDLVLAASLEPAAEPPKVKVPVGEAEMGAAMWAPMAEALRQGPCRLGDLRALAPGRPPNPGELLMSLTGAGHTLPVLRDSGPTPQTAALNRLVARDYVLDGRTGSQLAMASPVAGAGMACTWLELAVSVQPESSGGDTPDTGAMAARLLGPLNEEDLAEAAGVIARMIQDRRPVWRRFGII